MTKQCSLLSIAERARVVIVMPKNEESVQTAAAFGSVDGRNGPRPSKETCLVAHELEK